VKAQCLIEVRRQQVVAGQGAHVISSVESIDPLRRAP
jgi:hypothetical protein